VERGSRADEKRKNYDKKGFFSGKIPNEDVSVVTVDELSTF
jgi:hypothetical protein